MYLLESNRRIPAPMAGSFGAVDMDSFVRTAGLLAAGAVGLFLLSRTRRGRKMLRGSDRSLFSRARPRRVLGLKLPRFLRIKR